MHFDLAGGIDSWSIRFDYAHYKHNAFCLHPVKSKIDSAQVPTWSANDLDFFLHGSMSTEVVPEKVLRALKARGGAQPARAR